MVIKPSKEYLQEALTNNTFDIDATDKALRMTLDHSFSYLYRLQRNMVSYEEYFYTTRNVVDDPEYGDLYLGPKEKPCVNFPVELILTQFREKFRTSKYYRNEIDYDILRGDHQLFARLPVIMIDGGVLRSFKLRIYDEYFTATLPFDKMWFRKRTFDKNRWEYEYIDHEFSIQIINNSYYADIKTNPGMLRRSSYGGSLFDRIRKDYATSLGLDFSKIPKGEGTIFATIFFGDSLIGTPFQEVRYDAAGDLVIDYDKSVLESLETYTGELTIRFYFYRYLHRYTTYKDNGFLSGQLVQTNATRKGYESDIFLIRKDNGDNYQLPIPTENLLLYKVKGESIGYQYIDTTERFPNANVTIHYPNIYQIDKGCNGGDGFKVYYFYIPPYDLFYTYQYQFYYRYLMYRFGNNLEQVINDTYFGTATDPYQYDIACMVYAMGCVEDKVIEERDLNEFYFYLKDRVQGNLVGAEEYFKPKRLGNQEEPPADVLAEAKLFRFVIFHEITPYYYDEMDYVKDYEEDTHPFNYKVEKLKLFIKDDYHALTNYVRAQNKTAYKFEGDAKKFHLEERYRTTMEDGTKLPEPMYMFPVQKPDPTVEIAARIFIDGLFCSVFTHDTYNFTDIIYIPARYVKPDSYFEIEVFSSYNERYPLIFSAEHPYIDLNIPPKEYMIPTVNDIYFYLGDDKINYDHLDSSLFKLEYISDRYNYYTKEEPIAIFYFALPNGNPEKGPYYTADGRYFTYEGQPVPEKNVTTAEINDMIKERRIIQATGYETASNLEIKAPENYVSYDEAGNGVSTLTDDKGTIHSNITKLRVTLLDTSYYEKTITLAISKKPYFEGQAVPRTMYPLFSTPIENFEKCADYTRAFKNGRLLSRNRYAYTDVNGHTGIQILEKLEKDETIAFDVTPYEDRLIMYKEDLDSDLVDLRGYINKPFDPKFYEVYLNGRRLNKTNIFPFSPWEFQLVGVHSLHNLEIREKQRDWEYYGLDFNDYYTLSDMIREPFMPKFIGDKLIEEETTHDRMIDDTEEPMEWEKFLTLRTVYFEIFYYMKLIPMHWVDPHGMDFNTKDIEDHYKLIYDIYTTKNDEDENVLFLDPNISFDGKEETTDYGKDIMRTQATMDKAKEKWRVYLLGHHMNFDSVEVFDE